MLTLHFGWKLCAHTWRKWVCTCIWVNHHPPPHFSSVCFKEWGGGGVVLNFTVRVLSLSLPVLYDSLDFPFLQFSTPTCTVYHLPLCLSSTFAVPFLLPTLSVCQAMLKTSCVVVTYVTPHRYALARPVMVKHLIMTHCLMPCLYVNIMTL